MYYTSIVPRVLVYKCKISIINSSDSMATPQRWLSRTRFCTIECTEESKQLPTLVSHASHMAAVSYTSNGPHYDIGVF